MSESNFTYVLERVLEDLGITRYRLAVDANISQPHMTKLAKGDRSPTPEIMEKLAEVLSQRDIERLEEARMLDLMERQGIKRLKKMPIMVELADQGGLPPHIAAKIKTGRQITEAPSIEPAPAVEVGPMPPPGPVRRLPVFEDVSCGWGAAATEHPVDWEEWPEWMAKGADHVLRVRGNSMRDVGIEPGTVVFVRRFTGAVKRLKSGTKVIAHLPKNGNGDEYTCKMLVHDRHVSWLQGMAEGYMHPIYLHEEPKPRIVGVVTGYFKLEDV